MPGVAQAMTDFVSTPVARTTAPLSVCVYCGSRSGANPAFEAAARRAGALIGRLGWQLVYGGGHAGLMGVVADAALAAGGRVVGVIPQSLMSRELGHTGLAELHVVQTMHERKRLMAERSDAFLALPGGIGTMEELFEVWTWRQLGYHDKPVGLLNVAGYYDALLTFIETATRSGFIIPAQRDLLTVDDAEAPLLERLGRLARSAGAPEDYSRT
jgi:uncharacterized protein (TIGR00730 family)